ncbi:MAG: NPCBM/NEW2 domain-containing protein, partial [Clostridia bacterium]|nr:NPCBM/NEW2 domain-containing protein [Clostridia bacterium]
MKRFLSVFLAVSLCMTAFVGLFAMGTSGETSEVYLSDLDYIPDDGQGNGSWAGWSDIKINQTVNGGVPKINNGDGSAAMTFEKAVIAHASAQIEYDISDLDANRFMSYIGICADAGYYASASSCAFEVRVDGVSLYKSETILFSSAAEYVNVVIPDGAQKLTLIIDGLGDITADHAGWFDAKLLTGDELVEPTEVVFEKPLYAAEVGEAISVNAIALPEGADAGNMIFGIEDSSIAAVTADGKVYPRKAGSTNLTVKLPLYGLEAKAELRVLSDGVYELDTDTWTTVMSSDSNPIPREQPSANVLQFPIAYGNTNQDPGNALLQDVSAGDFVLTVKVSGGLSADYQAVGLVAYAGHAQMVAMTRRYHTYLGGNIFCIATYAEQTSYVDIAVADPAPGQDAFLKLEKKGDVFTGSYSFDGQSWTTITDTITSSDIANAEDLKVGVTAMTSLGGYVDTYLQDFTLNGEAVPFSYQCGDILLEVEEGKEVQVVPGFIGADAYNTAT